MAHMGDTNPNHINNSKYRSPGIIGPFLPRGSMYAKYQYLTGSLNIKELG